MIAEIALWPDGASTTAVQVDRLLFFLVALCGSVGLLIAALMIFFCIYYRRRPGEIGHPPKTALHALHVTIGIGVVTVILILAWRGHFSPAYYSPVDVTGLYWHFVDIVWIFLLPTLYLLGTHHLGS